MVGVCCDGMNSTGGSNGPFLAREKREREEKRREEKRKRYAEVIEECVFDVGVEVS